MGFDVILGHGNTYNGLLRYLSPFVIMGPSAQISSRMCVIDHYVFKKEISIGGLEKSLALAQSWPVPILLWPEHVPDWDLSGKSGN